MEPSGKRHWRVKEEYRRTRKHTLVGRAHRYQGSRMTRRELPPVSKLLRPEVHYKLLEPQSQHFRHADTNLANSRTSAWFMKSLRRDALLGGAGTEYAGLLNPEMGSPG
eukprot:429007-Pelagomonas_calceolata.AAC.1